MLQIIAVIVVIIALGKVFSFLELLDDFFPRPLQIVTAIITFIAFLFYSIPGAVVAFIICSVFSILLGFLLHTGGEIFIHLSRIVGRSTLLVTGVLCVLGYFAFSWPGVFVIAVLGIGISLLTQQIAKAGRHISHTIEVHDQEKTKKAQIQQQTAHEKAVQENERALQEELEKNCGWLGYTNSKKWHEKLSNYANKEYATSFDTITENFAIQKELQNITQNETWFTPFLEYIVAHPAGSTPTKLLNEVHCPQLYVTHHTPNKILLQKQLTACTKAKSGDVPALLKKQPLSGYDEPLYLPTRYAQKLYGQNVVPEESHQMELSFEDL